MAQKQRAAAETGQRGFNQDFRPASDTLHNASNISPRKHKHGMSRVLTTNKATNKRAGIPPN